MVITEICFLLLLVLPQHHGATLKKYPKKRSTNDSFNVNIGAGYGVGFDQNTPYLPESTTQINSTNPLMKILKNEHVIIGKYPGDVPKFDPQISETQTKKEVMDMKEIQHILHNVDGNSEYSKIVQVVKVPAVYEIHLEKFEKNHQHAPKQYIQQINNLANKGKKKTPSNIIYGTKSKDYVKIDSWQKTRKRIRPNPSLSSSKPNFREKKNTNFIQNYHRPEYYPQKHSVYSTLTRKVPFALRKITHRSDDPTYGTNKERVMNPNEINITIQPGTTMVTVPKLDIIDKRNFIESTGCKKNYSQSEVLEPPELKTGGTNTDGIYFTTLRPMDKEIGINRLGYYKMAERRSGIRPVKYMLYINKIVNDDW